LRDTVKENVVISEMELTMEDVMIEFKNVKKVYKLYKSDKYRFLGIFFKKIPYKKNEASEDLSFVIRKGESVALLGRNGAGKSTVLKMITKTAFPTEGEVIVNGRVSALLELTSGFDPEFTGRENIYLKGRLMGIQDSEIAKMEPEIIDFAGIGDYIDQPTRTYSSGMKARLGFAVNANIRPEIFIIDEALSVGDAEFKKKCLDKVKKIINDDNVTLVFVTHSEEQAAQFCDRGMVLEKGKVAFDGDINEAIKYYRKK